MRLIKIPMTYWIVVSSIILVTVISSYFVSNKKVDFNAEIKPLLNKKCITCHGGVKRQSGFSLLFRSDALSKNKSGKVAIIPFDAGNSEMIKRLYLKDPEERMPYKHPPLNNEEIALLTKWINQGAEWGDHWAYVPVKETPIPNVKKGLFGILGKPEWIKTNVDAFIYEKLQEENLTPSAIADKSTKKSKFGFNWNACAGCDCKKIFNQYK